MAYVEAAPTTLVSHVQPKTWEHEDPRDPNSPRRLITNSLEIPVLARHDDWVAHAVEHHVGDLDGLSATALGEAVEGMQAQLARLQAEAKQDYERDCASMAAQIVRLEEDLAQAEALPPRLRVRLVGPISGELLIARRTKVEDIYTPSIKPSLKFAIEGAAKALRERNGAKAARLSALRQELAELGLDIA